MYLDAASVVLADYSPEIINAVTDPRSGLAGRIKFLPTIAEIRDACQAIELENARRYQREAALERQLAERAEYQRFIEQQPKVDLRAKYPPNWGLSGDPNRKNRPPPKPAPSWDELKAHYDKYDIGGMPKKQAQEAAE